jgi:hypothetical protein
LTGLPRLSLLHYFQGNKKERKWFLFASLAYGRLLRVRIASTAPIMIITITTTAIPNSKLAVDAKPVGGAAVGAGDAGGELA